MKALLSLIIFVLFSSATYAQFPFLKGKESSGVLAVFTANNSDKVSVLTYDISSTRIAFNKVILDTIPERRSIRTDYDKNIFEWKLGVDLEENTFTVFNKSFQPGGDISLGWYKIDNIKREDKNDPYKYTSTAFELIAETQFSNFSEFSEDSSNIETIQKAKTEVGINPSITYTKEDNNNGGIKKIYSLSAFVGRAFNSTTEKKQKTIYEVTSSTTSGNQSLINTEKAYFKEPRDFWLVKPKLDGVWKIYTFDSDRTNPRFNNPSMFLISRYSVDISSKHTPKHSAFFGLSLTTVKRQTVASLIFAYEDFTSVKKEDVKASEQFSIKMYFGLPLN